MINSREKGSGFLFQGRFQSAKTPFFLTGGTALSRYYTHHRYSDDLDFFVINDSEYAKHVNIILQKLIDAENTGIYRLDRTSINKGNAAHQLLRFVPK